MELELIRTYHSLGTNGTLLLKGKRVCFTIDLPWKNNQPRISCIPEGKYELKKRYCPRLGWHILVVNVPRRSFILMHAANEAAKELKGCIAPVSGLSAPGKGILSRLALQKILSLVSPVLGCSKPLFLIIKSENNESN